MKLQIIIIMYNSLIHEIKAFHNSNNAVKYYVEQAKKHFEYPGLEGEEWPDPQYFIDNPLELEEFINRVDDYNGNSEAFEVRWYEITPEDVTDAEAVPPEIVTAHKQNHPEVPKWVSIQQERIDEEEDRNAIVTDYPGDRMRTLKYTPLATHAVNNMGQYLSGSEEDYPLIAQALLMQLPNRPDMVLDHVEYFDGEVMKTVEVWEKVQDKFTVKEFCDTVGIKPPFQLPTEMGAWDREDAVSQQHLEDDELMEGCDYVYYFVGPDVLHWIQESLDREYWTLAERSECSGSFEDCVNFLNKFYYGN